MALKTTPFVVTGGSHTAQQFRQMIQDLAQGNQGVTAGPDLKVSALSTPGGGVQIADGSAVINGVYAAGQGAYNVYNIGVDTSVQIPPASGTPRSDMVVLRVQDPDYEGNKTPDKAASFEVVPNVSSTATSVPSGYSAIPLARIDIPASTGTITNSMIKDLRRVANPRKERTLYPYYAQDPRVEISGNSAVWQTFPNVTMASIPIPSWAATAKVVFTICGVRMAEGNVWGNFRFLLGSYEPGEYVAIDDNQGNAARRATVQMLATIDLTTTTGAAMRGTTQLFKSRMCARESNAGKIGVDATTTFNIDIEFTEGAL